MLSLRFILFLLVFISTPSINVRAQSDERLGQIAGDAKSLFQKELDDRPVSVRLFVNSEQAEIDGIMREIEANLDPLVKLMGTERSDHTVSIDYHLLSEGPWVSYTVRGSSVTFPLASAEAGAQVVTNLRYLRSVQPQTACTLPHTTQNARRSEPNSSERSSILEQDETRRKDTSKEDEWKFNPGDPP